MELRLIQEVQDATNKQRSIAKCHLYAANNSQEIPISFWDRTFASPHMLAKKTISHFLNQVSSE